MMDKLEESYKIRVELMRHEQKVQNLKKQVLEIYHDMY
jgi:hypothetical protein